jgi:glutathione S-transferase
LPEETKKGVKAMIIFGAPVSPYVRKVLVYAHERGIEAESVPVSPFQPTPEFLAASPFSKVPAMVDDDFSLSDSSAIIAYLEAKHADGPLIPTEAKARGRTMWFDELADTIMTAAFGAVFFNRVVAPKFLKQEGDLAAADKAVKESIPPIYAYLEGVIPASGFLVEDRLTLADIAVASPFVNGKHCDVVPDAGQYPKLTSWLAAMHARPGFAGIIEREKRFLSR